ncbi:NADH-quinone oxidoreductase subunit N [Babesia caballi]|uniref:NADH-quinone oxidoreductase subunit N n=1 Tax=Babesia caballi TaxID=5871 RepID=A0AAV4LP00_BABCB|nr:NADH-quinone oxidoreductase subunit N [Babesia caballi]
MIVSPTCSITNLTLPVDEAQAVKRHDSRAEEDMCQLLIVFVSFSSIILVLGGVALVVDNSLAAENRNAASINIPQEACKTIGQVSNEAFKLNFHS